MDIEWWKPIPGYEEYYAASTKGRVRNLKTGKILKQTSCGASLKYRKVGLCVGGVRKLCRVHKLVWITFVGEIPEGYEINHIDEDPGNNALNNLELITHKENIRYGTGIERCSSTRCKAVRQYSLDGTFIKEWASIKMIEDECGFSRKNIGNCCRNLPHSKTAYGYVWKFAE